MAATPFGVERSEQPLGGLVQLREEYADHLLAYVPSMHGPTEDLAGRRLSAVDLGPLAQSVALARLPAGVAVGDTVRVAVRDKTLAARLRGHSRVPLPPHKTTGWIAVVLMTGCQVPLMPGYLSGHRSNWHPGPSR